MKRRTRTIIQAAIMTTLLAVPGMAGAAALVQCPGDTNGDAIPEPAASDFDPNAACMHLTGGDGWITMGDGRELYIFSFSDVTGVPVGNVLDIGVFRANQPAPTISMREGQKLYLTLTNVGTFNRPDLFDPHTVHYHGFPNASDIFDGSPDSTISINQQSSLTYWYDNVIPGTYLYHCHVEATEHMQMGMLGNLNIRPGQNVRATGAVPGHTNGGDVDEPPFGNWPTPADGDVDLNTNGVFDEGPHRYYAYNDGDGSTLYDVDFPIMLSAMDGDFHDQSRDTQPLAFAAMLDDYPMLNGRGYPDTTVSGPLLPPPADSTAVSSQPISSRITATKGQKILLRLNMLGVVHPYTVTALGLPMKVVGHGARLLRGEEQAVGENVFVDTNTVTLGGGQSADVLIDTTDVDPGTYFLYTTNLNFLSNNQEDLGGMMTEIVITN